MKNTGIRILDEDNDIVPNYSKWGCVYFIKDCNGLIKVGYSINIYNRMQQYKTQNSGDVELIKKIMYYNYKFAEIEWHKSLSEYRVRGERFDIPNKYLERIKKCDDGELIYFE